MSFAVSTLPKSGGDFAKAEELAKAAVVLIEPKRFEADVPTPKYGTKDTVTADVTIFADQAAIDSATPTEIKQGVKFQQTILARDLAAVIDGAVIVTIVKENFKGGNSGWVMREADPAVQAKVVEYGTAREAQIAKDLAEGPDF